jgi:S-DNA-T family DNA segregation ATPase FtsK/SpoIIIE
MAKQERKEKSRTTKKRITPKIIDRGERTLLKDRKSNGDLEEYPGVINTRHEIQGILYGALTLFLFVSLISYHYHAHDPISFPGEASTQNIAGIIGAFVSRFLFQYFGYIAYAFPFITLLIAIDKFRLTPLFMNYGNVIGGFLGILCLCALLSLPFLGSSTLHTPGGFIGAAIATILKSYLDLFGSVVIITTGLLTAGILLKKYLFQNLPPQGGLIIREGENERTPQILHPQIPTALQNKKKTSPKKFTERIASQLKKKSAPKDSHQEEVLPQTGFQIPSTTLLNKPRATKTRAGMEQNLLKNSRILEDKLLDFGIEGQVVGVLPGPVITRYEFQPAPGIKVSRIVNLSDDLALAMKATAVRIVAPVPGKDVVGIEVPNATREIVYLRDILDSKGFANHSSKLALGFGKDIGGRPYIADLTKMPHLLIAGATGSGKSVCLNSLICSILFHATPDEVRFIMVDPKTLELGVYDGIPHLLIPVVKSPQQAANALNWATEEMTRRYGILAQKGVRNVAQYNEAILDFQNRQHTDNPQFAESRETLLPYIVIIIDELADLMIVSAGVEKPITRLAQMARAVGIHLILATQRPSVDVITGVIKANFPARISFRVSSKVDSRTILDANGAESLLGDGDMLFLLPGTSRIRRLHGSFVTEKEIKRVTTAIKKMGQPHYDQSVIRYSEGGDEGEEDDEALYEKAVHLVVNSGEASISMLRRSLKIGHSRASRLIDLMEKDGIVGGFKGSRPRDIILTPEQLDNRLRDNQ